MPCVSCFIPPPSLPCLRRTYNPEEGRGRTKPASQAQAMEELAEVGGWVWVGEGL